MVIQFNLLPDIKIEYLRARRQKHLVLLGSVITIVACVVVMAVLISITFILQKKNISDLSSDIDIASNELKETPDLNKMLSVQNQLKALPALHDAKPVTNRVFGYIAQATPASASISRVRVEHPTQTIKITGSTDDLATVNVFVDALKFATYHTAKQPEIEKPAFSDVVLSAFGRDDKSTSYTITFKFNPLIFSELEDITLVIPKKVTTRSQTEQPAALFQKAETE